MATVARIYGGACLAGWWWWWFILWHPTFRQSQRGLNEMENAIPNYVFLPAQLPVSLTHTLSISFSLGLSSCTLLL